MANTSQSFLSFRAMASTGSRAAETDLGFNRLAAKSRAHREDNFFDVVIMERAENLAAMPHCDLWSDLGDWQAVWRDGDADINGVSESGPLTAIDCRNNLSKATSVTQHLAGIEHVNTKFFVRNNL